EKGGGHDERQGGAIPRQDGSLLLETTVLERAHRSIMTRSQTIAVMRTTPEARKTGSRVAGIGLSWRIASSAVAQRIILPTDSAVPSAISVAPRISRPPGKPSSGTSWRTASPPAIKASEVRIQARNVRSLASVNR